MTHEALSQAEHIINVKLGGINAAARILGHRNPSTVQGWLKRGFVPGRRPSEVLRRAREAGIAIDKTDFVTHLEDPELTPVQQNVSKGVDPSETSENSARGVSRTAPKERAA